MSMTISQLSEDCRKCSKVNTCTRKRMEMVILGDTCLEMIGGIPNTRNNSIQNSIVTENTGNKSNDVINAISKALEEAFRVNKSLTFDVGCKHERNSNR